MMARRGLPLLLVMLALTEIALAVGSASTSTTFQVANDSLVGSLKLNSGEGLVATATIDSANGYAYFGTWHNPAKLVRVKLSDFTRVDSLILGADQEFVDSVVIDSASLYLGIGNNIDSGVVVKVRLTDFTRVAALSLNSEEIGTPRSGFIDSANGYVYFIVSNSRENTAEIVKIRLSDFTRVGALILPHGGFFSQPIIANGFAYLGGCDYTSGSPTMLLKIQLSSFSVVGSLTLNQEEYCAPYGVVDSTRQFGYFAVEAHTPNSSLLTLPARLVKIQLSDLTRAGTLMLKGGAQGEYQIESMIVDAADNAYIGLPTEIVQVRLPDLTRVSELLLEGAIPSGYYLAAGAAALDNVYGFAYFGLWTEPGIILKIDLHPAATVTSVSTVTAAPTSTGKVYMTLTTGITSAILTTTTATNVAATSTTLTTQTSTKEVASATRMSTATVQTTVPTTSTEVSTATTTSTAVITVLANPPVEVGLALLVVGAAAATVIPRIRAMRSRPRICKHCGFAGPRFAKTFCVKCGKPMTG